jgi:hypothetical protein
VCRLRQKVEFDLGYGFPGDDGRGKSGVDATHLLLRSLRMGFGL